MGEVLQSAAVGNDSERDSKKVRPPFLRGTDHSQEFLFVGWIMQLS